MCLTCSCEVQRVALHGFIFHWLFYQFWLAWSSIFSPFGSLWAQFWLHFGSILELLGLHLASQGLPLGTVGSLWAAGCPQEGSNERKAGSLDPPWAPILKPCLVNFSMKFLLIFVYVFWITFGAILDQFWEPEWIQNRLKIDSNFDQKMNRILEWFLKHVW